MSLSNAEFNDNLEHAYSLIVERKAERREQLYNYGYYIDRVSFEEIDLDDIFLKLLVPLIPNMLTKYGRADSATKVKMRKVYLAAMCEVAKGGFPRGGILVTIDEYIGKVFNRNQHYQILKDSFEHEGIEAYVKNGRTLYEETIINESGIPRRFHRKAFRFFMTYWKWLKPCPDDERRIFLNELIEDGSQSGVYIYDQYDWNILSSCLRDMHDFKEKLRKTCEKLEKTLLAIDDYPEPIDSETFEIACYEISSKLGFNILTIIRADYIQKMLFDYATKVSFSKFAKIVQNVNPSEQIKLPNGTSRHASTYSVRNFLGGTHRIQHREYEVSYPVGLSLNEIFSLPCDSIYKLGQYIIYKSLDLFEVDIDGHLQLVREFIMDANTQYVFAGRIPSASYAYIDGIPIQGEKTYKISESTGVRKFWDRDEKCNILAFYVGEVKIADKKFAMKSADVSVGDKIFSKSTNSNGYVSFKEKWIDLTDIPDLNNFVLTVALDNSVIIEQAYELENLYIFSLRSGRRIFNKADMLDLWGDARVVIFTKGPITTDLKITEAKPFLEYTVYIGHFEFNSAQFFVNEQTVSIWTPKYPYISLKGELHQQADTFCMDYDQSLVISLSNVKDLREVILEISHDKEVTQINASTLSSAENIEVFSLVSEQVDIVGVWTLSLYVNQRKCDEKKIAVLAEIYAHAQHDIYLEGEDVFVDIIANSACFDVDETRSSEISVHGGIAKLQMIGNLVSSEIIEVDVYNAKCDIYQSTVLRPYVWGVRNLLYSSQTWSCIENNIVTYDVLHSCGQFICTTKSTTMTVSYNDYTVSKLFYSGFNKLGVRSSIPQWRKINMVTIGDKRNNSVTITIPYQPSIAFVEIVSTENYYCAKFKYNGPINTKIKLTAFLGNVKVASTVKTSFINSFSISLYIDNPQKFLGKELSIECRFDDQDSYEVMRNSFEWKSPSHIVHKNDYPVYLQKTEIIHNVASLSSIFATFQKRDKTPAYIPSLYSLLGIQEGQS
jgi:hypothetical protein